MLKQRRDKHLLGQETHWFALLANLLALSILGGLINYFSGPDFFIWQQINVLLHVIVGSLALLPLLIYSGVHIKRTLGVRSIWVTILGFLSLITVLALFFSGIIAASFGQAERFIILTQSHTVLAYVFLILLLLHLLFFWFFKRRKAKKFQFLTINKHSITILLTAVISYSGLLFITSLYFPLPPSKEPEIANYQYDYGAHPFRPSQTETESGHFVLTEQIAKSEQCGVCHQDIYQQWLSSAHRQAASDPAYVKNINLLEANRGISATRYCEGCHAPVALLTGQLTPGGQHGGIENTPANLEGVGCMGCHGIQQIVHTNGVASFKFSPKEDYLLDGKSDIVSQKIRNFLIRLSPNQHKKAMDSKLMQDPATCATCHEQFMDKSMNNWGWVKMQSEYTDWLNSAFSGQGDQSFKTEEALTCQGCHFPLVAGNDPSADTNGMVHSHRSLGANTILPFLNGDQQQLQKTIWFLQNSKLLVAIEQPHRNDVIYNLQTLNQSLRPVDQDNTPYFLYLGEEATITVAVTNRMVGHNFPGGTTDINQAWLAFEVSDGNGERIHQSGYLDENYELDKSAHIYHSIPVDREGKAIWKHDLFRMTGDAYKNVIPSGKSDIKSYTFSVPVWAKNPLTVSVTLKYRKFNQHYARWALNHLQPVLPVVDMARDSLTIPLKVQPVLK